MKRKKTILFTDYAVPPVVQEQKRACVENALAGMGTVGRGGTLKEQVKTQLGYVGPWFWLGLAAVLVVMLVLLGEASIQAGTQKEALLATLALFSASGPVVACLSAPVLARSYANDMWELEEASFYNLPRLTALRLFICALAALPVMTVLAVAGLGITGAIQGLTALAVPFLLASGINYCILGRLRGLAGSLCSIGIGLLLAVLCPALFLWAEEILPLLWADGTQVVSAITVFACGLFFVLSARRFIRNPSITY
ncbi:hypothetical protein LJC56_06085 [Christensenellaceae bacterium OttesenSCG-928-K19]|nr:hypothetical protein [Christensenellaceae bacterium OttesenSCG-928-K19]